MIIIFVSLRDIKAISGLLLRAMWFLSPVLYTTEHFMTIAPTEALKQIFLLNPMVMPINLYRIGYGIIETSSSGVIISHYVVFIILFATLALLNRRIRNQIVNSPDEYYKL